MGNRKPFCVLLTMLLVLLSAPGLVLPGSAQSPETATGLYTDPAGRFTLPVPTTWTVDEQTGFVEFSDPDGDFRIAVVIVTGSTARAGIESCLADCRSRFRDGTTSGWCPGSAVRSRSRRNPGDDLRRWRDVAVRWSRPSDCVRGMRLRSSSCVDRLMPRSDGMPRFRRWFLVSLGSEAATTDLIGTEPASFDAAMPLSSKTYDRSDS